MATGDRDRIEFLRAGLRSAGEHDDILRRRIDVVGIVNDALATDDPPLAAVIVGGTAVNYWIGPAFVTHDVDLLLPSSERVVACMEELGFRRLRDRRHWEHPEVDVLIEMPDDHLSSRQTSQTVEASIGTAEVLSIEDVLVDRLHSCNATGDYESAQQALSLLEAPSLDRSRLDQRADEEQLADALANLRSLQQMVNDGSEIEPEDVHGAFGQGDERRNLS